MLVEHGKQTPDTHTHTASHPKVFSGEESLVLCMCDQIHLKCAINPRVSLVSSFNFIFTSEDLQSVAAGCNWQTNRRVMLAQQFGVSRKFSSKGFTICTAYNTVHLYTLFQMRKISPKKH